MAKKRTDWRSGENRARVKASIRLLRAHVRGYETRDGFSLKNKSIDELSAAQKRRLLNRAQKIEKFLATPHEILAPKTSKARRSLYKFTGQRIRGAKHFIVHLPSAKHRARIVGGNLSIRGTFTGGVATESRYFLFPHRPRSIDDAIEMTELMLPGMPAGFYVILTSLLGDTGEPVQKGAIIQRLEDYWHAYGDKGFDMLGYRFMSSTLKGAATQRERFVDQRRKGQKEVNRRRAERWSTPQERAEKAARAARLKTRLKRSKAAKKAARTRRARAKK